MAAFLPSRISINTEILRLLEAISGKQGQLSAYPRDIRDELDAESTANVDAVHFSTKIEGNALSRDQVTRALQSGKLEARSRDLREVLNYARVRRMVREWSQRGRPFNDTWVLEHHFELLKGIVTGKLRGHYRNSTCAVEDSRTKSIIYIAPDWREVSALMTGLLGWLRRQIKLGSSPLLLAAQFHFEFVTIHPFMDGNGRLARLLTNGILMGSGYDVERYAALEKRHEENRAAYYMAMRSLQARNYDEIPGEQDIRTWVVYWLECLLHTYEEASERIGMISRSLAQESRALPERFRKADALFRRYHMLRASEYADLLGIGRTQAVEDLNALVKAGRVERIGGGRSTMYRHRREKQIEGH